MGASIWLYYYCCLCYFLIVGFIEALPRFRTVIQWKILNDKYLFKIGETYEYFLQIEYVVLVDYTVDA